MIKKKDQINEPKVWIQAKEEKGDGRKGRQDEGGAQYER